ncbi:antibiotic biosynthesis monooxygenase [Chryseobacterium sp. KBW03]|jgi:quinol monooxygenase YgiN|uniref:putative quinol monooxygenase n=1 Tax=Chryseobacterium sp. KBW03 TaxID=2153362 RepID=UPI000F59A6A6|nr:putative quinol monooxygenase [Chryseobacterium sp. KBW03]RQO35240.1 antibiotic biosynthesis monooxygenase [Chryseobacterium sp. KBW03]
MNKEFKSVAVLKSKPEKREELKNALQQLIDPTRNEAGCIYYILFEDKESPGTFYMWEAFKDDKAFEFHTQTEHFKSFADRMDELMSDPIQVIELERISQE